MSMMRTFLESRLQRVTVTQTELRHEGSCAEDEQNHVLEVKSASAFAGPSRP
jgi:aspartate 1-decarboxylase